MYSASLFSFSLRTKDRFSPRQQNTGMSIKWKLDTLKNNGLKSSICTFLSLSSLYGLTSPWKKKSSFKILPQWSIGIIQIISIDKALIVPALVPHQHSLLSHKVGIRMLKATEKETDVWDMMLSCQVNENSSSRQNILWTSELHHFHCRLHQEKMEDARVLGTLCKI